MWAVFDSIKRSGKESIYSQSFGTILRISRICKESSFSRQSFTRRKIFTAPKSEVSSNVLLMIRILFTEPVTNAKLERMFSKLKHVKTNFCCSLGVKGLKNILRITEDGSSWETFDPIWAIKQWNKTIMLN